MRATLDQDIAWESNNVELLRVANDNKLRFYKHVSNICLEANKKLNALKRVAKFVPFLKKTYSF